MIAGMKKADEFASTEKGQQDRAKVDGINEALDCASVL